MPIQPIKSSANYEKYFSNEIRDLLKNVQTTATEIVPSLYITPEIFFLTALEKSDCLLYKVLNGHLTTLKISEIYEKIESIALEESQITVARPNRTIEYSNDMKLLFQLANKERANNNDALLTSDHILMAIMNNTIKPFEKLYDLFTYEMLSYEIIKNLSSKIHETANSLANLDDKFYVDFDPAMGNDTQTITIMGNLNDGDTPEMLMNGLTQAFEAIGLQTPKKKSKKTKGTISYCTNLNNKAEMGQIDPIIERDKEIKLIAKIFGRRLCNNVILVGETGVGKTAIVEGIAKQIVDGNSPQTLKNCQILSLNTAEIMAGTQFKGMFEDRMLTVIKELKEAKNSILFIDDIHNVLSERQRSDYDFGSLLSSLLNESDVKVIVTTTPKGYHSAFNTDPILARKFQKIIVDKLDAKTSKNILMQNKYIYENYHNVTYTEKAIEACVSLSEKYITDRCLPSSAIDILDEAGADKKIINEPESIKIKKDAIVELKKEKESLIKSDKIAEAKAIDCTINGLKIEISKIQDTLGSLRKKEDMTITADDIYKTVSEHTNIPIQKLNVSEKQALSQIETTLKKSIIGQDEAINVVSKAIRRNKIGLGNENRPIFSCMCIGSSGVGKTLLAKNLAKEVFGNEKYLVRFDMSEYNDKTSVNKLIGASAGYVGYNEGGLLTEAIKNKKYCVLLIDEIEKATDEIFNLFLQILDEGYLTDNTGQKVDFKNTIIILTSNIGAKKAANTKGMGFVSNDNLNRKEIIENELKKKFSPEFINRLDEIVYFNNLTDDNLKNIIKLELNKFNKKLNKITHSISYNDDIVEFLFKKIEKDKEYGARPILRIIQNEIENKITDLIIDNDYENHCFNLKLENNDLVINY